VRPSVLDGDVILWDERRRRLWDLGPIVPVEARSVLGLAPGRGVVIKLEK
jgi:hypothetical protein